MIRNRRLVKFGKDPQPPARVNCPISLLDLPTYMYIIYLLKLWHVANISY